MADDRGRAALRREAHTINDTLLDLFDRLDATDGMGEAARCIVRARVALFEAWTLLCTPPEEEEDD